jgi:hypothetical protein
MLQNPGATLIAEIGSVTTRVTLVDTVDGEARMIGQASVPSTTEPPFENAVIGILEAATQLSEMTGRQLMRDGSLLMPQSPERDGIDTLIGVTSAGAPTRQPSDLHQRLADDDARRCGGCGGGQR